MALYKELSVWADVEEWVETEGCAANVDDARAKLGVLRRLLTGVVFYLRSVMLVTERYRILHALVVRNKLSCIFLGNARVMTPFEGRI